MPELRLQALLGAVSGSEAALILTHNDPDPDAIGSAVALRHLLVNLLNVPVTIAYRGIIGRAENRALVRYLDHPLQPYAKIDFGPALAIALVDTQPGVGNSPIRKSVNVDVVIDHHPWHPGTASARFYDVRTGVGAASTQLTEYLRAAELEIPTPIATALFYGISSDTMGLGRSGGEADIQAYSYLVPLIDSRALFEIERAQVPADYFRSLVGTLQDAQIYRDVLIASIGWMKYPDLAAEIADWLLRLKGIQWVVCIGAHKEHLIMAVRNRLQTGAGTLAQYAIGEAGTAGGHGNMAGGQMRLNGRDPAELAQQLTLAVLAYFNIDPEETRRSLL